MIEGRWMAYYCILVSISSSSVSIRARSSGLSRSWSSSRSCCKRSGEECLPEYDNQGSNCEIEFVVSGCSIYLSIVPSAPPPHPHRWPLKRDYTLNSSSLVYLLDAEICGLYVSSAQSSPFSNPQPPGPSHPHPLESCSVWTSRFCNSFFSGARSKGQWLDAYLRRRFGPLSSSTFCSFF